MALAIGRLDVDQCFAELTADQALEWLEFSRIEPFGSVGIDYRMAYMLTLYFNAHQDKQPYTVEDFLPQWGQSVERQTVQQQLQIAKMYAAAGIGRMTYA